jgi:hypothetical protein
MVATLQACLVIVIPEHQPCRSCRLQVVSWRLVTASLSGNEVDTAMLASPPNQSIHNSAQATWLQMCKFVNCCELKTRLRGRHAARAPRPSYVIPPVESKSLAMLAAALWRDSFTPNVVVTRTSVHSSKTFCAAVTNHSRFTIEEALRTILVRECVPS